MNPNGARCVILSVASFRTARHALVLVPSHNPAVDLLDWDLGTVVEGPAKRKKHVYQEMIIQHLISEV